MNVIGMLTRKYGGIVFLTHSINKTFLHQFTNDFQFSDSDNPCSISNISKHLMLLCMLYSGSTVNDIKNIIDSILDDEEEEEKDEEEDKDEEITLTSGDSADETNFKQEISLLLECG